VRLGVIDFMLLNPANIEAVAPKLGVINIPYQFDDYAHAHRTLDTTGSEWLQAEFKKARFPADRLLRVGLPRAEQPASGP